ncbi:MAG: cytochrome c3 family protein, partial [Thermoleophilia bacterium]
MAYWPVIARIALIDGAVFLAGFMADEVTGQSLTDPHGAFSEDTRYCLLCHAMHQAPGEKLQRLMPEAAVCFTCHNGSGSNYNTQAQ